MKYRVNSDKVTWRILDGEVVIINNETSYYYSLNKTGTFLWNLLVDKEMSMEEIVANVCSSYDQNGEAVIEDIKNVLDELYKEKLIERK